MLPALLVLLAVLAWPARRVRLASWNLHNLFDEVDDPYADDVPSPARVQAKLQALAQALRDLNSDMVAVQEVENRALLERLAHAAGYRYAILVEGNDTQRGIDVGFLSRVEVSGYRTHREDRLPYVEGNSLNARFSRDCLEVHVPLGPGLIVLVNHFKARVGKARSSALKRRAQALRVAEISRELQHRYPGRALVVAGDLNDGMESWALEPLAGGPFYDPFARLGLDQGYTLKHRGEKVVLDHILVNDVLRNRVTPQVWHEKSLQRCSDHFPISVDIAW